MVMQRGLAGPANASATSGGGLYPQNLPGSQTPHTLSRIVRYAEYAAYYAGDQWPTQPQPGERRLTFNYCRVVVNKGASYLLGKPIDYDATPPGVVAGKRKQGQAAAVEEYLRQVGDFNHLAALDLDMAVSAGMFGDGAYTVRWDAAAGLPRITGVPVAGLDCRWRADDLRTLLWVRQTYWLSWAELSATQQSRGGALSYSDPYTPLRAHEDWTASEWRLTVGDIVVDGGPNVYGVIPYIIFPNLRLPGEFWGESDLVDLLRLQREINTRLSIFSRILEVSGNPVAVVYGADEEDTKGLRLGPNELWTLPSGAKADVLDLLKAGGADAHLKYLDVVYRAMHDISEMPRTAFGDSRGAQARSGVALEIELQPLLHKLARKRAILGAALEARAQLCLTVARLHGAALAPVRLRANWPPVLPQDRAALVQQEAILVEAGIHPPTKAMEVLDDDDAATLYAQVLAQAKARQAAGLTVAPGKPTVPIADRLGGTTV